MAAPSSPPETATAVVFEHGVPETGRTTEFVHEQYSWGWQTLPRHFGKAAEDGSFLHYVAGTVRPVYPEGHPEAGNRMRTQWLVFKFRSEGVFGSTTAHIAVIGRAEGTATWSRGRGFALGHLILPPGQPGACPPAPVGMAYAQPETWWTELKADRQISRSHVFGPPLCSPASITDFHDYEVAMHVADGGWGAFWIIDLAIGEQLAAIAWRDQINAESDLVDGLTGYALALVFGASSSAWRFKTYDIRSGWF
jgi:hypothetical protein